MNILQLSHRLPWPPIDGGKKGTLGFAEGYRKHPDVTSHLMLCMCPREESTWATEWAAQSGRLQVELMDARNTPARFARNLFFSRKPFTMQKYDRVGFHLLLESAIRQNPPDVVHFDSLHTTCYSPIVQRLAPKALRVLRCHNAEFIILERLAATQSSYLRRKLVAVQARRLKSYETAALSNFNLILPISAEDFSRFRGLDPAVAGRMVIVPAGAEVPTTLPPAPAPPSGTVRLIHVAAMDWLPNQSGLRWFVSEVLPKLDAAGIDYHLDVIGKNTPAEIYSLANSRVTIHGFVRNLDPFARAAHLAVVPLQVGGGMRIKILDYWALGIPVIATRVGAEGLIDSQRTIVELADDPAAFAKSIVHLSQDADAREQLRMLAFAKVREEYSWQGIIAGLVSRYKLLQAQSAAQAL